MVRRLVRRGRRTVSRRRRTFRRRRATRPRVPRNAIGSSYDSAYGAKCTISGNMVNDSTAQGAQVLVSWGQNKTSTALADPYATPEFQALASRFQEYRIVGFKIVFIPAYQAVNTLV